MPMLDGVDYRFMVAVAVVFLFLVHGWWISRKISRLALATRNALGEIAANFNTSTGDLVANRDGVEVARKKNVSIEERSVEFQMPQQMTAVVDSADDAIITRDLDGTLRTWNPAAQRLLGYSAEEIIGKGAEKLIPLERRAEEAMILESISKGHAVSNFETERLRKDGSLVQLSVTVSPIRDGNGSIVGASKIMRDISERKQAENALSASEQRYRFLSETMPQIIWSATPEGNMCYFNRRWYDYTGLSFEQSMNNGWEQAMHPEDVSVGADRWKRAHLTGCEFEVAVRIRRAVDGAYRWHLERASPLRRDDGTILQWVGTCTDIDDHRRATEELAQAHSTLEQRVLDRTTELRVARIDADQANLAKSEFLANMSHEIRTPLNAVIGLGYLLEQTTLSEDQRQYLSKIQVAGRSLLSVVNNVLDLSKIEAREMALDDESFDLPELILDVSKMLAPQASAKGIELIVQPASDLPQLAFGDATRLRQILTNLLNNAIKFTDAGQVALKASCSHRATDRLRLRCEVQDTGIGIEAAAIERLFLPFTQADASTTRRFGGTGLGLSIARRLVELMGGEIDVTSALGVGSTFCFEIPLRIPQSSNGAASSRGLRICIADSSDDAGKQVAGMVHALGWTAQVLPTGGQLIRALCEIPRSSWPHLIITQLSLSDMKAPELIARLEKEYSQDEAPPVIVIAEHTLAIDEHTDRERAREVALRPPFTSSALFNAVNAAVFARRDCRARVLQSNKLDELNAQWLIGVRVLVVDDSAVNREVAQGILQGQGAIVSTCCDGAAALDYVRAHHQELDAVLMDVQMPVLDGNEATRLIRTELNLQTLPILALTAGALIGERKRSLQAGMNDTVTKPFDPQVLIRKVRQLVEGARGEPVPIAILDVKRVAHFTDTSLMSSIDAAVVTQMFGHDLALFKAVLSRMLRDYAQFAEPIADSLEDHSGRALLKARLHELRGSAGLIGATRVMRLAAAAEAALEQERSIEVVNSILGQLTSAFSALSAEALSWLGTQSAQDIPSNANLTISLQLSTADLDELYALLDHRNLAALDKFILISASLSELLGAVRFGSIRDAIESLDFPRGAQLLREYRGAL